MVTVRGALHLYVKPWQSTSIATSSLYVPSKPLSFCLRMELPLYVKCLDLPYATKVMQYYCQSRCIRLSNPILVLRPSKLTQISMGNETAIILTGITLG